MSHKLTRSHAISVTILTVLAAAMLLPYLWMVLSSLKSNLEIISTPSTFLPEKPTFAGYETVFQEAPFGKWMFNSAITSVLITGATLLTSTLAGYVFAKFEFPGRRLFFLAVLATMMIPFQVIMIPTYLIVSKLGLINHLSAIVLPNLVSSYGVFLAKQFIEDLPKELMEAARIDGAGEFKIMAKIIAPLIMPMLSALGIFTFMTAWNSYLWPLISLNDLNKMTVPLALIFFNGTHVINYNVVMSAAVLIMVPVIVVFLLFQKQFIKGLTMTGMK